MRLRFGPKVYNRANYVVSRIVLRVRYVPDGGGLGVSAFSLLLPGECQDGVAALTEYVFAPEAVRDIELPPHVRQVLDIELPAELDLDVWVVP